MEPMGLVVQPPEWCYFTGCEAGRPELRQTNSETFLELSARNWSATYLRLSTAGPLNRPVNLKMFHSVLLCAALLKSGAGVI